MAKAQTPVTHAYRTYDHKYVIDEGVATVNRLIPGRRGVEG